MSLCRRAKLNACEKLLAAPNDQRPPLNTSPLYVRAGDVVDFGITWTDWLAANAAKIKTSAWAAAGAPVASPDAPTLGTNYIDQTNGETIVIVDASDAEPGDEYIIENTVVFEKAADAPVAYADRTLVRRLQIKVVSG